MKMTGDERENAYLRLQFLKDFEVKDIRRMIDAAGSVEEVTQCSVTELMGAGIDFTPLKVRCFEEMKKVDLFRVREEMELKNIHYFSEEDPDFPENLKNIDEQPLGLFCRGSLPSKDKKKVAIIGARRCSNYGKEMAWFFGKSLAEAGIEIISGMAMGIDGFAGKGACSAGEGSSFAVLAGGVDSCYPRENIELYDQLIRNGNGVISERAPGCPSLPFLFPIRNRIVSGFSDAVVIIEASLKSGTMITVSHALRQNREVFALPGRVNDYLAEGTNRLLKNGAQIATCPEDILQYLGITVGEDSVKRPKKTLTKEERIVYEYIGTDPAGMDELLEKSAFSVGRLLEVLMKLELKGVIRKEGISSYVRV